MLSAIEILPGVRGQIRPVRIVARDVPYYSNDSRWWSQDAYFKGGQISSSHGNIPLVREGKEASIAAAVTRGGDCT